MVLSNAERQARYQQRLRQAAYENDLQRKQIAELERRLNETRRAVDLPEIQLPRSAYGDGRRETVSAKIDGDAKAVLDTVQEIFDQVVPGARCQLQDYEHRIGCGALDEWGNIQDVTFLRRGISESDVLHQAKVLSVKVATGGSTAGPMPDFVDEDEEEDRRREHEEISASRNPTTGY